MLFTVSIASVCFELDALFAPTKAFFQDYLSDDAPLFRITVTADAIAAERTRSVSSAHASDEALELVAIQRELAEKAPLYGALQVHGSAIAACGEGYLFLAASGTGKSTHARLWRQMLGSDGVMVNDDKPFLLFREGAVYVCGSPWMGKHRLGSNMSVPLKAAAFLERGAANRPEQMAFRDAAPRLFEHFYRPCGVDSMRQTMRLIAEMEGSVQFFRLICNMEPEASEIAYHAMRK